MIGIFTEISHDEVIKVASAVSTSSHSLAILFCCSNFTTGLTYDGRSAIYGNKLDAFIERTSAGPLQCPGRTGEVLHSN